MVPKPFGFILALCSLCAAARKSLSTLVDDCNFTINGRAYDLCPLFNSKPNEWRIEVESDTPPTITKHVYRIALGGALSKDKAFSGHEQCPDGTWICMTAFNRGPDHRSEPPRIIQLVPVAGSLPSNIGSSTVDVTAFLSAANDTDVLEVRLHGGNYVQQPQIARFRFHCDITAQEPSMPSFAWSWNGSHTFSWSTPHACSYFITEQTDPADDGDGDREADTPQEDDSNEAKNDDLVDSIPVTSTGRMFTVVFISITSGILLIGYLIYSPPHRLKQLLTSYLGKSKRSQLPFRTGESVLIRWAQQDMGMDDNDEDVMVNYHEDDDPDEQIPLKPSPGKQSHRLVNYGSAMG